MGFINFFNDCHTKTWNVWPLHHHLIVMEFVPLNDARSYCMPLAGSPRLFLGDRPDKEQLQILIWKENRKELNVSWPDVGYQGSILEPG